MNEIVNKLHENRQIQLAKEILESAGYTVSKILSESTIPVDKDCVGYNYYLHNGYTDEEVEEYKEQYSIAAEALGVSIDDVLSCSEDSGVEAYNFIKDNDITKVKNILNLPGVHRGLYKLEDGTLVVLFAEWGYEIYYFVDPAKNKVRESTGIDSLLNKVGGYRRVHDIIQDTINSNSKNEKIEGDIYGVADLTYPMVKDKVSRKEWEEIIEYVW